MSTANAATNVDDFMFRVDELVDQWEADRGAREASGLSLGDTAPSSDLPLAPGKPALLIFTRVSRTNIMFQVPTAVDADDVKCLDTRCVNSMRAVPIARRGF